MKLIKPLLLILIIGVFFAIFNSQTLYPAIYNILYTSPCDIPIAYRVDTVDSQFNISKSAFLQDIQEAGQIWSKAYGKELFVYDPKGNLSINLIFDERQRLKYGIDQLDQSLDKQNQALKITEAEYKKQVADFESSLADLNNRVAQTNARGGATPEEYAALIKEQESLKQEASRLNEMGKSLNYSAKNYNAQVNELKQDVGNFNQILKTKPEEGVYNAAQNRIEIYFNNEKQELIRTLAHELGHARGLMHSVNPKAIMYSSTTDLSSLSPDDILAIQNICKKQSIFEKLVKEFIKKYDILRLR